jgi:NAD+ kinase
LGFKIGLVSRLDDQRALDVATSLAKRLKTAEIFFQAESELARLGRLGGGKPLTDLRADLIVTVGGDGTVLKTCMSIPDPETPILAVNMGRRGYLTEVEPGGAFKAIRLYMNGKCWLERRAKIAVHLDGRHIVDALNELVVSSGSPAKMLDLQLGVGTEELVKFRGDGVIISTPTGSTAYSLSAGGPIVDSSVDVYVITFICPLKFVRPTVVSMDRNLSIQLADDRLKASVVADGRFQREIRKGVTLELRKAERSSVFVRMTPASTLGSLVRLKQMECAGP